MGPHLGWGTPNIKKRSLVRPRAYPMLTRANRGEGMIPKNARKNMAHPTLLERVTLCLRRARGTSSSWQDHAFFWDWTMDTDRFFARSQYLPTLPLRQ